MSKTTRIPRPNGLHPSYWLAPGQVVKIFQKPLTDEEYEGTAKVVRMVSDDRVLPQYDVRFRVGDGKGGFTYEAETCQRVAFMRNAVNE